MEPDVYVSLDLETTGLNPQSETILEIGAVKFRGGAASETWHTLVNPKRPIPPYIQALTGITNEMVGGAPIFSSVAGELAGFVRDAPIVGHRISFDLAFLAAHGLSFSNPSVDTWELASILFPELPNHRLGTLAGALGPVNPTPHRALADALAARDVFLALIARASALEYSLLQGITELLGNSESGWGPLLRKLALRAVPEALRDPQQVRVAPREAPLRRASPPVPVDENEVEALLGQEGPFRRAFPNFEERPQQASMARVVTEAFNEGGLVLIEAGTGVGKSLAYLLPSAIFATANSTPVVISTNTINLQEQLLTKDVPTLRRALETAGGALEGVAKFRVALLKGRSNYLCLRRWLLFNQGQAAAASEARFRARLLIWLSQDASGDRGDLNLPPDEIPFWSRVSALADDCSPANCPHVRGGQCFLFAARDRAKAAHIVLVNHALLLSDLARDGMVLPEHQHVVVDEAHHLEEEATHQWGLELGEEDLTRFLSNLLEEAPGGKRSGLLSHVGPRMWNRPAAVRAEALQVVEDMESSMLEARRLARDLFHLLSPLVARESPGPNADERRLRLTPQVLGSASWAAVVRTQEALTRPWMELEEGLGKLYILLGQGEDLADEAASRRLEAQNLRQQLTDLTGEAGEDVVRWASLEGQGRDRLCSAPLHVGELLHDRLLSIKETVVLTSATLTTQGTFEHLKDRLGLTPRSEVLLGSPYDYKASTLLWVAQDMPEPGHRQYQAGLERTLVQLLAATEGRALVLFTSHSALRAVLNGIRGPLEKRGLLVLGQSVDGSRNQLLDMFKSHKGTVLLGTSSFWEGVDVVGDSLSVVVITRLPFHVPSDPVFAARSQAFEDGFSQYALPLSILRFRQGFGRLIRSHSDRGVMAILDSRLHRKAYGRAFLKSLPKCTVRVGPAGDLPGAAADWLCSSASLVD